MVMWTNKTAFTEMINDFAKRFVDKGDCERSERMLVVLLCPQVCLYMEQANTIGPHNGLPDELVELRDCVLIYLGEILQLGLVTWETIRRVEAPNEAEKLSVDA